MAAHASTSILIYPMRKTHERRIRMLVTSNLSRNDLYKSQYSKCTRSINSSESVQTSLLELLGAELGKLYMEAEGAWEM